MVNLFSCFNFYFFKLLFRLEVSVCEILLIHSYYFLDKNVVNSSQILLISEFIQLHNGAG